MAQTLTTMSLVGTPVSGSRWWTTAFVPFSGNWHFIVDSYNHGSGLQDEWAVINLFSGTYTLQSGTVDAPGNSNYNCTSFNYPVDHNQLLCSNGRVFFPKRYTQMAYYNPADGRVHELPKIPDAINDIPPATSGNEAIFRMEFDRAGWLYGGTQCRTGFAPMIFKIHTGTLSGTVLGHAGNTGGIRYAYYLAPDPPYVYVAAGQDPWELCSIHTGTLSGTIIARPYEGMEFNPKPEGWTVRFASGGISTDWWIVDNMLHTYSAGYNPLTLPFTTREVTSSFPVRLVSPPQIDYTLGIGKLRWRATGSAGPFTTINYTVNRTSSIEIESANVLPDSTLIGSTVQYGGFFVQRTGTLQHFGNWNGVSQAVLANSGSDTYMCGYPNGVLYRFNQTGSWQIPINPVSMGNFTQSDMKYCYFIQNCSNGRLYVSGRRERDGEGGALGYYDVGANSFGGHHSGSLSLYDPRGFVVLESLGKVVFSGEALVDSGLTSASLMVYDMDLNFESFRQVNPSTLDTGKLYRTSTPGVIVGLVESPKLIYRYHVGTDTVMKTVSYTGSLGVSTQRSDYTIWAVLDGSICKIDPDNLDITRLRNVSTL